MKKAIPEPVFKVGDEVVLYKHFAFRQTESADWQRQIDEIPEAIPFVDALELRAAGWEYRVNYGFHKGRGNNLTLWTDADCLTSPLAEGEEEEAIASILRGPS